MLTPGRDSGPNYPREGLMVFTRRLFTGLISAAALTATMFSTAQAFEPNKPINFIIMAGKGGGADKMARLMQAVIEKE